MSLYQSVLSDYVGYVEHRKTAQYGRTMKMKRFDWIEIMFQQAGLDWLAVLLHLASRLYARRRRAGKQSTSWVTFSIMTSQKSGAVQFPTGISWERSTPSRSPRGTGVHPGVCSSTPLFFHIGDFSNSTVSYKINPPVGENEASWATFFKCLLCSYNSYILNIYRVGKMN